MTRRKRGLTTRTSIEDEVEILLDGWDWPHIFKHWRNTIEQTEFDPENDVFQLISVFDPANPDRNKRQIIWWPVRESQSVAIETQRRLALNPGVTYAAYTDDRQNKGTNDTAKMIAYKNPDPEVLAALLLSASLFSRCRSHRVSYPYENWPVRMAVRKTEEIINGFLSNNDTACYWAPTCTDVLPVVTYDYDYKIDNLPGLIRYLAEEHVRVFASHRILIVDFVNSPNKFMNKIIEEAYKDRAIEQREHEEWLRKFDAKSKADSRRRAAELEERKKAHPRCLEWQTITPMRLENLVWSTPVMKLANEFGVSGPAVKKKCKSLGIETPRPGFWQRVNSGKISHPNGVSPNPCVASQASRPFGQLKLVEKRKETDSD